MRLSELIVSSAFKRNQLKRSFYYQEEELIDASTETLNEDIIINAIQFLLLEIDKLTQQIEAERLRKDRSDRSIWHWKAELEQFPFRFNWNFKNPQLQVAFSEQKLLRLETDRKFCLQFLGKLSLAYANIENLYSDLRSIKIAFENLSDFQYTIAQEERFSFLKRNWLNLAILFTSAHLGRSLLTTALDWKMILRLASDMWLASCNILQNWIAQPMLEIWETVRYSKSSIRITDEQSVSSEIETLNRMVADYKLQYLTSDLSLNADFDPILREYEQNLKAPIKSAVFGNLFRLMLIQVQKAKVDLGTAMLSLDKLMRANELNFEMLAVIPVMVFLAYGWSKGKELWLRLSSRSRRHLIDEYKWTMHDLDMNIMNEDPKDSEHSGQRIFQAFKLAYIWHELNFSSKLTRAFQEDLQLLIEPLVPAEKRLITLNRMRMFYKL